MKKRVWTNLVHHTIATGHTVLATGHTVLNLIAIDELDNSQAVALDSQLSLTGAAPQRFLVQQSNKTSVRKRLRTDFAHQTSNRAHKRERHSSERGTAARWAQQRARRSSRGKAVRGSAREAQQCSGRGTAARGTAVREAEQREWKRDA